MLVPKGSRFSLSLLQALALRPTLLIQSLKAWYGLPEQCQTSKQFQAMGKRPVGCLRWGAFLQSSKDEFQLNKITWVFLLFFCQKKNTFSSPILFRPTQVWASQQEGVVNAPAVATSESWICHVMHDDAYDACPRCLSNRLGISFQALFSKSLSTGTSGIVHLLFRLHLHCSALLRSKSLVVWFNMAQTNFTQKWGTHHSSKYARLIVYNDKQKYYAVLVAIDSKPSTIPMIQLYNSTTP